MTGDAARYSEWADSWRVSTYYEYLHAEDTDASDLMAQCRRGEILHSNRLCDIQEGRTFGLTGQRAGVIQKKRAKKKPRQYQRVLAPFVDKRDRIIPHRTAGVYLAHEPYIDIPHERPSPQQAGGLRGPDDLEIEIYETQTRMGVTQWVCCTGCKGVAARFMCLLSPGMRVFASDINVIDSSLEGRSSLRWNDVGFLVCGCSRSTKTLWEQIRQILERGNT